MISSRNINNLSLVVKFIALHTSESDFSRNMSCPILAKLHPSPALSMVLPEQVSHFGWKCYSIRSSHRSSGNKVWYNVCFFSTLLRLPLQLSEHCYSTRHGVHIFPNFNQANVGHFLPFSGQALKSLHNIMCKLHKPHLSLSVYYRAQH